MKKINERLKDIHVPGEIEPPLPIQKGIGWKGNIWLFFFNLLLKLFNGNIGQFTTVIMH